MISKNLKPHRVFISVTESNILSKSEDEVPPFTILLLKKKKKGRLAKLPQADGTFKIR
jgi:hypothetical protein